MVDILDICKSLNIGIGTVMKIPEMLKLPYLLRYS